jgi:Ca2+-binding RTX toxin-like protein
VFGKNNTTAVALGDIVAGTGGFVVEGENLGDFLGIRPIGGGDVTGDGFADLVLGSPAVDLPGSSAGRGYVVFAKDDGTAVPLSDLTTRLGGYRIVADATQGQLGWAVDHAGDVDGDGFDMILTAYEYNGPAGADAGRIFVVFGGNDRGAVTHLGTAGDDTLDGSAGSDVLVAGAGADVVHGGGGSDVIYAGAGDDTIGISGGSFFRIDGGTGVDTLAFEDGGVNLSLALVPDLALRGVEIVDLTGTGDNGFSIARRDLRKLVGASKSLRIEGDAGDTFDADLTGGTFVDQGVSAGVHTWSDGVITLEVVDPVVANVQL